MSAFQLAILLRRDKALLFLLEAAARFAHEGEPSLEQAAGRLSCADGQDYEHRMLLAPAMRRVTDCLKDAFRSDDMTQVVYNFLCSLSSVDLLVPETFLPRIALESFSGSPSPAARRFGVGPLLWNKADLGIGSVSGFPAAAQVVMLPGLASFSMLELLAEQTSAMVYTPPMRCLIDTVRVNGAEAEFFGQARLYLMLQMSGNCMLLLLSVDLSSDIDSFSFGAMAVSPRIALGVAAAGLSLLLAMYFLLLEVRKLVEDTFPDSVEEADEEQAVRVADDRNSKEDRRARHISFFKPKRETWWRRMLSQGGFQGSSSQSAVDHSHVLKQASRQSHKHLLQERLGSSGPTPPPPHSTSQRQFAPMRHAPHISTLRAKVHPLPAYAAGDEDGGSNHAGSPRGFTRSFHAPPETWLRRVSTQMSYRFSASYQQVQNHALLAREACAQEEPALPGWLRQRHSGRKRAKYLRRAYKSLRRALQSIDIDLDYFRSGWNWMALSCFSSVMATCICHIQAWQACHALISHCSLPRPSASTNLTVTFMEPWTTGCQEQVQNWSRPQGFDVIYLSTVGANVRAYACSPWAASALYSHIPAHLRVRAGMTSLTRQFCLRGAHAKTGSHPFARGRLSQRSATHSSFPSMLTAASTPYLTPITLE